MVNHMNKKTTCKKLDNALKKIEYGKKLDAKKFCGVVNWGEDGLSYQLLLKDEWD